MSDTAAENHEIAKWDPSFTEQLKNVVGPLVKAWFRADVRGLDNIAQAGGALVVSNHSGGMMTPDVLIFASAFYEAFGYQRPVYTLAHYGVFLGPLDGWLRRAGVIEASRENAATALHSGAVVLVENEGNARLTTSAPKVHIAVAGLEKLIPRAQDLATFLKLLGRSGTGQPLTVYTSFLSGPRRPHPG